MSENSQQISVSLLPIAEKLRRGGGGRLLPLPWTENCLASTYNQK